MSGLEVAGVVLGGIPVIVNALQCYADGVATIKSVFQYEDVYLDIHASLVVSMTIFQQSCEELLRGLLLPDSQFCALIEKQEGWEDPDLINRLKLRMGDRDFQVYTKFTRRLRKRTLVLAEKLQLQSNFIPVFVVDGVVDEKKRKQFFKNPITRVRGAFEAAKLKKLVAEIGNDIEKLRDLSKGAMDLEEERHERALASTSAYWLSLRDNALRLFSALQSIWPHTCQSHSHKVSLRVDLPASNSIDEDSTLTRMTFHLGNNGHDDIGRDVTVYCNHSQASTIGRAFQHKKARFSLPSLPKEEPAQLCKPTAKIENLCTLLIQHYENPCLGFFPYQKWQYHLHDARDWPHSEGIMPLRGIFSARNRMGVTPRERCIFATRLASAVLQLFETPWLNQSWTLADVYVDCRENDGQIYIPKLFDRTSTTAFAPSKKKNVFVKNEIVFALGIALLELTYGKDIRSFTTADDLDENNREYALTLYSIADRLTREIQKIETPRFARAVAKCICPASDTYEFELTNDGFRNRFYLDVVQPLQQEYETLFPPKRY
ncbi:hypothetical protein K469DRAFT_655253 [Zopfia rhizophila CBS 207.26]|uniref:DUF7580 domain-containing protein n=1 Tax=Zopfia rhizophila CBS 207.26 TaxID=1314779 RepID=A0A6A6ELT9_9PEZI|nr:hypothetical protein K469DRAFT_655253 [Zopfia rhizophila CBS 207.26]